MHGPAHDMDEEDEQNRTLFCGGIADETTEDELYELFLQVGETESSERDTD